MSYHAYYSQKVVDSGNGTFYYRLNNDEIVEATYIDDFPNNSSMWPDTVDLGEVKMIEKTYFGIKTLQPDFIRQGIKSTAFEREMFLD